MLIENYYRGKSDFVGVYGKLFSPDSNMGALVVMVHGIGQHGGCFDEWAEKFTLQSVGFLTFDLRGHGHSSGRRGHTSIKVIHDDLRAIIQDMHIKFPDIPIVLFGHSMGGQIVLGYGLDENTGVQGIIASSPFLKMVHPPSPLLVGLAKWASHVAPWLTVRTGIRAEQLSQNGAMAKSTKTDSLLHKKISIRLFTDLYTNSEYLLRNRRRLNTLVLLMHGTADPLVSFQASELFAKQNEEMVTFKEWRDMRHDLLNDAGNDAVFRYVMNWLSKHVIDR